MTQMTRKHLDCGGHANRGNRIVQKCLQSELRSMQVNRNGGGKVPGTPLWHMRFVIKIVGNFLVYIYIILFMDLFLYCIIILF